MNNELNKPKMLKNINGGGGGKLLFINYLQ
jgi:hypothetical protein